MHRYRPRLALIGALLVLNGCSVYAPPPLADQWLDSPELVPSPPEQLEELTDLVEACFGTACFLLEVADDQAERAQWLMDRDELAADRGMLFVFDTPSVASFWMKDTRIPLDMIWLDETKRIIHLATDVPPCETDPCPTYGPAWALASYVIELNAWTVTKHSIELNQRVDW